MYLENLSIHGFKSFAKKTKFLFNDGITAIVGPNGCGKSNIVDALRWVLGEQKAGTIRSDRMENVIFNGARNVKPLGMAEVSLTIQNTRNVLPINYSEVVITRRLFRSLESQYLLNNTPCRLKDIQDLLMDTGMGPDAYSIIELSMVETILNGKPEERRKIIEEAAGVTKYKVRRKAAFRKLEATEADLVRVNDIISEVEKTVASLQRQVRKARRYQEMHTELKEKEIAHATYIYSGLQTELQPLTEQLKQTQDSRVSLASRLDEKEAQLEEKRRQLLEQERSLSTQQKQLNELSLAIQKKEEVILVDRERRRAIEEAKIKLTRDREELKVRLEKTEKEIAEASDNLQGMFGRIQVAENDFQEKNSALKKIELRIVEKNEQLKNIERQRVNAIEGLTESKKDQEHVKTQIEHCETSLQNIDKQLEENKLLASLHEEKVHELTGKKTVVDKELARLTEEADKTRKDLERIGSEREATREKMLDKRGEIQGLKERIQLLKKFIESYEDHPEGVQHLLRRSDVNGGYKGTLSDVLTVDALYRQAIETALGEAAVSLVVDGTDRALEAIQYLKSDKKGSVTFYPIDNFASKYSNGISESRRKELAEEEGVIDWAYNLVSCEKDYRHIVQALLSDYLVVTDIGCAQKYASSLKREHLNLITLNGEIISTWGPIRGGEDGSSDAGLIGRKELVDELEAKLGRAFKDLEKLEKEQSELESRFRELSGNEQQLDKSIKESESQSTELEVKLAQLNFEGKKDKEAHERLTKERSEQQGLKSELIDRLEKITPSLDDLSGFKARYETDVEQISLNLKTLEEEVKEYRDIAQDSRVQLVDLKSEERHQQEVLAKLTEYQKELIQSRERIDSELKASAEEYVELEGRIEQNKEDIQSDFGQRDEQQAAVEVYQQKYQEAKSALDDEEKALRGIRGEKDTVSENLHTIELRVSELRMSAQNIKERIREEYSVEVEKRDYEEELDVDAVQQEIERLKARLESMGPVNLLALKEYEKEKSRLDFLTEQRSDLIAAEDNLKDTIRVINKTAREQFNEIFEQIQKNFTEVFSDFFPNGQASLRLAPDDDPLEAEVVIEADPKGKRISALTLLSGGEKTLTAISLLFSIYLVKPSPFCILDEVDAPLDDANIGRFVTAIRKFSEQTQFMIVTHNKLTMRAADSLYGITMAEEGVSKVVSVNFKDMKLAS